MRILKLTRTVEERLLRSRQECDKQAARVANRIVGDVRRRGDEALFAWAKKLDGSDFRRESLWVAPREFRHARSNVSRDFVVAVEHAARNMRRVAEKQLPQPWELQVEPGVTIAQIIRPIESIGCYVPGGRYALVSTLLMTVIPAQVADVPRIIVACPSPNAEVLAAANILGVREVARIGGAQAIAALAYGTRSVPRVEKIVGPGNRFVTAAKQAVANDCAIDLPAGPTETVILASSGNPAWMAADLLAQAEHGPDAECFLVTTSRALAEAVREEVVRRLQQLPRSNPAHVLLERSGAVLLVESLESACEFVNRFAPEHLSLPDASNSLPGKIRSAGTVFVGPWAAQALGDYASGSNHVLPTGGWARKRGGLSAADFVKCITVQSISRAGYSRLAPHVRTLAQAERLIAHERAVGPRP